jgi:hypothetical protein
LKIYPVELQTYCQEDQNKTIEFCNIDLISKSKIIQTIADGTCLIHAFLISTSQAYRKLSTEDKYLAGTAFRLYKLGGIYQSQKEDAKFRYATEGDISKKYLSTDVDLVALCEEFQINVYLFVYNNNIFELQKIPLDKDYNDAICLFFASNHFSSVKIFNKEFKYSELSNEDKTTFNLNIQSIFDLQK